MNVLDENIIAPERERLREWRIHFRYIGGEVGHLGMKDREEIIPLLHSLRQPTFFTRDQGFYSSPLLHQGYCLVFLDVEADETSAASCATNLRPSLVMIGAAPDQTARDTRPTLT